MSLSLEEFVKKYKQHEIDFLLPNFYKDTEVYLDLYLLYHSPDKRWHEVHSLIVKYFKYYLKRHKRKNISDVDLLEALRFPEVVEIGLGYCKQGTCGRGGGIEQARAIKKFIFDNQKISSIGLEVLAKMAITIDNTAGPDLLSDLIANFGIRHLIKYTHEQARLYDLKLAEYPIERSLNLQLMSWDPLLKVKLPFFEKNGEPRILVPRHLVRQLPIFSTGGFHKNFLRYILKYEQYIVQEKFFKTLGKKPKITFKKLEEEITSRYGSLGMGVKAIARQRPDLVDQYVDNPKKFDGQKIKRKRKDVINWNKYIKQIEKLPTGQKYAHQYAEIIRKIFTVLYDKSLVNGTLEKRSSEKLFHYDVNFANAASTQLFDVIKNQRITAGLLLIEAKNYNKTDVANKEFNQAAAYTINDVRELIFLIKRQSITEKDIERAKRHFLTKKILILPLSDEDLIQMLNNREKDIKDFDLFLVGRVQNILSA